MALLNTIAQRLADEIKEQDWSDAHERPDGARHNRVFDRTTGPQLTPEQTERVHLNVVWVVGQALAEDDPNFNIRAFAEAAGVSEEWLLRKDGRPNRGIEAGIRPTRRELGDDE